MEFKKCLVLSPHPDDMELACGGTIQKFDEVLNLVFSTCGITHELTASSMSLDVKCKVFDFPVRKFSEHRQEILQAMIDFDFDPDVVMMPSSFDEHQDHQVIHQEGKRAFKHCRMLGYESPWNNFSFKPDTYSILTLHQLGRKMSALNKYRSQQNKNYFKSSFTNGVARMRGTQIGVNYAESFETIRWII